MSKFLIVLEQGQGCDYTIGCGTVTEIVEANNKEDAFRLLVARRWSEYESGDCDVSHLTGEGELASVSVYEIADDDGGKQYPTWLAALIEKERETKATDEETRERAELQRLQGKYS